MGQTIKISALIITLATSLLLTSCGTIDPFGSSTDESASVALSLSMSSTLEPDRVFINVTAQNYNQNKEAPFYQTEGLQFSGIPLGEADIYVEARLNTIKLLDGHCFTNLHSGFNSVHVALNNVLIAYRISPNQDSLFDKSIKQKTPFWDILAGKNCAALEKGGARANGIVQAALGEDALFILLVLNDENFIPGSEINGPDGEWLNDAFILYFCKVSAYQPDFFMSQLYRIQCQMGETEPEEGKMHLKSFNFSPGVDIIQPIADFQDIEAKLFSTAANTRVLEMRIPKEKIGIGGIGKPGDTFALALRYNNIEDQGQTDADKIDWKNRMGKPLDYPDPWGNLEFQ